MKTVLMSSALALMLAPAAMADQMAVVDFNEDGIVSEADFIGSKARLDDVAVGGRLDRLGHDVLARLQRPRHLHRDGDGDERLR